VGFSYPETNEHALDTKAATFDTNEIILHTAVKMLPEGVLVVNKRLACACPCRNPKEIHPTPHLEAWLRNVEHELDKKSFTTYSLKDKSSYRYTLDTNPAKL
jgi:hypothetical protein